MASIGQRSEMREYERGVIFRLGKLLGTKGPGLVEVKDVVLADSMKRAMAGQAQSERERRAKITNAEGEFQAAEKLVQAAFHATDRPAIGLLADDEEISERASPQPFCLCHLICLRRSSNGRKAKRRKNRSRHNSTRRGQQSSEVSPFWKD